MRHYEAPLNVDLSPEVRSKTYRQRRVNAAMSYAKWAAKKYSKVLRRQAELISGYDAVEGAGGEVGIARQMATYLVHEPLRQYAARVCIRLIKEKQ